MVKKGRLGSDPLSWIGDSRKEESENQSALSKTPVPEISPIVKNDVAGKTEVPADIKQPAKSDPVEKADFREPAMENVRTNTDKVPVIPLQTVKEQRQPENKNLHARSMELLTKSQNQTIKKSDTNVKKNLEHEGKYLTFVLADEEYGLEINRVKEINGLLPITRVPRTPRHILGVINLRGKIVSVMDMRLKFGMEKINHTQETCIIVMQTRFGEKGILVDKVSEVINIRAEEIEPVPEFGATINTDYILGIGKTGSNVKILLDIDKVLSVTHASEITTK